MKPHFDKEVIPWEYLLAIWELLKNLKYRTQASHVMLKTKHAKEQVVCVHPRKLKALIKDTGEGWIRPWIQTLLYLFDNHSCTFQPEIIIFISCVFTFFYQYILSLLTTWTPTYIRSIYVCVCATVKYLHELFIFKYFTKSFWYQERGSDPD